MPAVALGEHEGGTTVSYKSATALRDTIVTDRTIEGGNAIASVRLSVRLFPFHLQNRLTVDLELLLVSRT